MKFLRCPRLLVFLIVLGWVVVGSRDRLLAQRVIAVMDPYAQGRDLKFDINADTTDNVAPTILFHPDGKMAYVSYAGSGTVVAFNPFTGIIVEALKTGGYPSQMCFSPDRSLLLIVDAFSNRIITIDVATFSKINKWSFTDAQFGFSNNLEFSADGKTGYITNWRFDSKFQLPDNGEIIRFSLVDGKEAGSRLTVQKGPVQLITSPDKKSLVAVNTVSETVSIVDLATFTVRATMTPETGSDFTHLNKVAISADSAIGLIANRAAAAQILASDYGYIFQLSDGAVVKKIDAGSSPLGAYTSPDGKYFLMLYNFGFKRIDISNYDSIQDVTSSYSEFSGNTNLVFGRDNNFAFMASPDQDAFMGARLETGGIERNYLLTKTGETKYQAMQIALSPDGKLALVLSFKSNTVTSIVDTYNTSASFDVDSATFSGFSLINTSAEPVPLRLEAADINSQPFVNLDVNYMLYQDELVALTSSNTRLAQSFQVATSNSNTRYVRLYLKRTGTFSADAKLKLTMETDSSSVPSGGQLENAIGTISANNVSETLSYVDFRFSEKAPLAVNTTYWLILSAEGTYTSEYTASTRLIEWGVDGSDPIYSSGNFATYATSWTADTKKDGLFSVILSEVDSTKEMTLQPGEQLNGTQDLFRLDDSDRRGRILITAEKPGIKGYWATGRRDLTKLDGDNLISESATDFILPEVLQVENQMTGYSEKQNTDIILTSTGKLAQSFQVEKSIQVWRVQLYTNKLGTFSSEAKLQLTIQTIDSNGKPTGTVLENATAAYDADSLFTIYAMNQFQFENPVLLEAGVTYAMVLEGTGTYSSEYASSTRYVQWGVDGETPTYSFGQFIEYTNSAWATDSAKDGLFKVLLGDRVGLNTRINLVNMNYNFTSGVIDLIEPDGTSSQEASTSWPGIIRMAGGFEMFLSPGISDRTDGYLRVKGQGEIALYEDFGTGNSSAVLPAIPINAAAYQNNQLVFPHFIEGPNIFTRLNIINLSREQGYSGEQDKLLALTGTNKLAQSFQLDQTAPISLIRLLMKRTGGLNSTATMKASLQTDSGGNPSGTVLPNATVEIDLSTVELFEGLVNIRFPQAAAIQAQTTYWIVLEPSGTYPSEYKVDNNLVSLCVDSSTPTYAYGMISAYANNAWTTDNTMDAIFQVIIAEDNEVTVSLFSPGGKLMTPSVTKLLSSGGQWKDTLAHIFPNLDFSGVQQGWIQVSSAKPGIVGNLVYSNEALDFMAAARLQTAPLKDILFAQLAHGSGWETGWAFLNTGAGTADAVLEVYDPKGVLQGSKPFSLASRNNRTIYFGDMFPELSEMLGGYVRVRSSQPLFSFSIYNDTDLRFLSMIPAQAWE